MLVPYQEVFGIWKVEVKKGFAEISSAQFLLSKRDGPANLFMVSHKIDHKLVCVFYYCVCVFYYCRTYYKAVRVGGGGEWRTCAMRDDEPRPVTNCGLRPIRNVCLFLFLRLFSPRPSRKKWETPAATYTPRHPYDRAPKSWQFR